MSNSVTKEEIVWEGKWIRTKMIHYKDNDGIDRTWEGYERTNFKQSEAGAVIIIPIISYKDKPKKIIVIKQFRPSTNKFCIEFPAGLCDPSEDPKDAALRELKEETGFIGTIERVTDLFGASVALGNTVVKAVIVRIDGDHKDNQIPETKFDEGEFVETIFAPYDNLSQFLHDYAEENGCIVDVSLGLFSEAISISF